MKKAPALVMDVRDVEDGWVGVARGTAVDPAESNLSIGPFGPNHPVGVGMRLTYDT